MGSTQFHTSRATLVEFLSRYVTPSPSLQNGASRSPLCRRCVRCDVPGQGLDYGKWPQMVAAQMELRELLWSLLRAGHHPVGPLPVPVCLVEIRPLWPIPHLGSLLQVGCCE